LVDFTVITQKWIVINKQQFLTQLKNLYREVRVAHEPHQAHVQLFTTRQALPFSPDTTTWFFLHFGGTPVSGIQATCDFLQYTLMKYLPRQRLHTLSFFDSQWGERLRRERMSWLSMSVLSSSIASVSDVLWSLTSILVTLSGSDWTWSCRSNGCLTGLRLTPVKSQLCIKKYAVN